MNTIMERYGSSGRLKASFSLVNPIPLTYVSGLRDRLCDGRRRMVRPNGFPAFGYFVYKGIILVSNVALNHMGLHSAIILLPNVDR